MKFGGNEGTLFSVEHAHCFRIVNRAGTTINHYAQGRRGSAERDDKWTIKERLKREAPEQ